MNGNAAGVWVVGAGYLGSALADALRAAGERVLTIDTAEHADTIGSAALPSTVTAAAAVLPPHTVYCCTATKGGDAAAYRAAYTDTVRNILFLCPGAHLIFCSSTALYAGRNAETVTEDTPVSPASARHRELAEAEQLVLRSNGSVARLAALYGPGRCALLQRHLNGTPQLPGEPERLLNYIHRDDAVCRLLRLKQIPERGIFNLCGETFSKKDAYALLSELTGIRAARDDEPDSARGTTNQRVISNRLPEATTITFREFVIRTIASAAP